MVFLGRNQEINVVVAPGFVACLLEKSAGDTALFSFNQHVIEK
jgi:hypothetical protein